MQLTDQHDPSRIVSYRRQAFADEFTKPDTEANQDRFDKFAATGDTSNLPTQIDVSPSLGKNRLNEDAVYITEVGTAELDLEKVERVGASAVGSEVESQTEETTTPTVPETTTISTYYPEDTNTTTTMPIEETTLNTVPDKH